MLPVFTTTQVQNGISTAGDLMLDLSEYAKKKDTDKLSPKIELMESDIAEVSTKITALTDSLKEYIAKTDAILKNHYDALLLLCQQHEMVDKNTEDGNNITPA